MKRKLLLSMMLMFLLVSSAWAQRTITGTVTSADGALPGATIQVKGTQQGTQTDIEGKYTITVPEGTETLVYRFVGYKTVEETIGNRTVIDVTMMDGALETVFVTGYTGNKTREELISAVSVVGGEDIAQVPLTDVNQLIQGRVAGAQTTSSVGQPGVPSQIRVRGTGSVGASRNPLYVIDGIIVQDSPDLTAIYLNDEATQTSLIQDPLSNINPNDIENITILKDATAVALYGSRGANGVVLVTTKSGSKGGKTSFKLSSQYGTTTPNFNGYENLSTDQFIDYYSEALANSGYPQSVIDGEFPADLRSVNTNWVDEAFRTGTTQSHNLSASGGNEKTNFFASAAYFQQEGVLIGSDFERYSTRLNLNHKANDRLSFGVQLNVSYSDRVSASPGNQFNSPLLGAHLNAPFDSPRDPITGELVQGFNFSAIADNFVRTTKLNKRNSGTFRTLGNINGSYKIAKGLSLDAKLGVDWVNLSEKSITDLTTNDGDGDVEGGGIRGRITQGITEVFTLTSQAILRYNHVFNEVHNFDVLVGAETQSNKNNSFGATGTGFANGLLLNLNSAAVPEGVFGTGSDYTFVSTFANANYSYMGKYRLTASVRRDGSSRFSENNQAANFAAVGGSWSIKEEAFLADVDIINLLKLRAGYGISGNANFSTQADVNPAISNFPSLGLYSFSLAYDGQPAAVPTQLANSNLKWERTGQFDIGLDFGILKERINGSIDWYSRESVDLLFAVPVPSTTGFTTRNDNIGKVRNTGVEVQVVTRNVVGGKDGISWTSTFLYTANRNEVIKLPGGEDIINGTQVYREGEPIRSFYLRDYQGADPETGKPTWLTEEGTVTLNYGEANRRIVGNAVPKWYGSFINTVSYKGIDFSALLYFVQGNSIYNSTRSITDSDGSYYGFNQSAATLEDRWQQPGDIATRPQVLLGGNGSARSTSTRYLEDGSYIRLRNITLGYTLPTSILSKAKLAGVRVFVQGTNLWTATNYTGFDPEADENGTEFFRYPNGKAFTFGIDISL